MRRAKASAETALAADDTLSEGHAILGLLEFFGDWNWHGATERLERALQLNPNSANAHQIYAIVMTNLGRPALAVSHSRHGVSLDPLSAQMMQTLQFTLHQVGEYGESMEFAERALEIAPDYLLTHNTLGFTFVALDRLDDAERAFRKVLSIAPHEPQARAGLAKVFAKDGRREEAQQCVRELERLAEAGLGQVATCTAFAHAEIDNIDQAFAWVERAIVRHEQWMVCLPTFGWWDPMRRDPRFEPLLRRLNFPEWSIAYSAERARTVQ